MLVRQIYLSKIMAVDLIWAIRMWHHGLIDLLNGHRLEALGRKVAANSILIQIRHYMISGKVTLTGED